jgi:hypothetical protein
MHTRTHVDRTKPQSSLAARTTSAMALVFHRLIATWVRAAEPLGASRSTRRWGALLVALTSVYAAVAIAECFGGMVGLFDQSLYYFGALLVSRGQRVHVDFHSVYPPFNYQPAAWMFSLLGETVLAVRLLHVGLYIALLAGLASLFRTKGVRGCTLTLLLLASLAMTATLPTLPSFPGVCLSLFSILAYLHSLEEGSATWARAERLLAAALGALTLFTRINYGLYALALFVADGAIAIWNAQVTRDGTLARRSMELAEVILAALLSTASLTAIYQHQLASFVQQVLVAPSLGIWTYSKPAFGADGEGATGLVLLQFVPSWLALRAASARGRRTWVVLALAVSAIGAYVGTLSPHEFTVLGLFVIMAPLANQIGRAALPRAEFVALLGCAFFLHYYVSLPDFAHQFPATAPLALLLPVLANCRPANWHGRLQQGAGVALVAVLAAPVMLRTHRLGSDALTGAHLMATRWPKGGDAALIGQSEPWLMPPFSALFPDENENLVVRYLQERTGEHDHVYIGLQDHSRPFLNDMRLYLILGRWPGARHHMLGAGVSNTAEAESEMIQDLITRGVRWVVLWQGYRPYRGFHRQNAPGARLLDDYLSTNYRPVKEFGPFEIREKR